jgi:hypothetical protein
MIQNRIGALLGFPAHPGPAPAVTTVPGFLESRRVFVTGTERRFRHKRRGGRGGRGVRVEGVETGIVNVPVGASENETKELLVQIVAEPKSF